jgi:hypothetical protein
MPEAALVAAQTYLLNTQPEPRDPRESMHQAAIKSLGLIGDELKQRSLEKEATRHDQKEKRSRRSQSPQTRISSSPRRRNYKAQREDARNIIMQARVKGHAMSGMKEITKTKRKKWGHYVLPEVFAERRYPKGLSCRMTSKNMMDHRSRVMVVRLSSSCQNTWGLKGDSNAKLAATPHRRSMVLVKQVTRRFYRKLGRARKSIYKQFPLNIYAASINRRSEILYAEKW